MSGVFAKLGQWATRKTPPSGMSLEQALTGVEKKTLGKVIVYKFEVHFRGEEASTIYWFDSNIVPGLQKQLGDLF